MIRIKAVDAQNLLDVCRLKTEESCDVAPGAGRPCCNAFSIAEAKYDQEMHPNAIYCNRELIGFFMYRRPENRADSVTICRFMLDGRFKDAELEARALEHVLRGLKILGVRRVTLAAADLESAGERLRRSCGFSFTENVENGECRYEFEL